MYLYRGSRRAFVAIVASAAVLATSAGVAHADDPAAVTATETASALADVGGLLTESDGVKATTDADSASVTTIAGTTVDIPKDANDGVVLSDPTGPDVTIVPANSDSAGRAVPVDNGVVAYPGTEGAATAVQATEDGGVRLLTVIAGADSPSDYTFDISVPAGGSVQVTQDGGAEEPLHP